MKRSPSTTETEQNNVDNSADLTIHAARTRLDAGTLTSETVVSDCIARARAGVDLNVFITLDEQGALAAARAADALAGGMSSKPLGGIPIVVKDNIHAAGLPCTAGTPALAGFVPETDAPVVQRLREAGAIILGKTNMHELAFGGTGYNAAFHGDRYIGVRNPYDPARIAGGSSSGSAAALGARMALGALGTDTGGSMRIPCALNGCASLRPSTGRYPQQGIAPISTSRDTAGPMALCMDDVALLDGVISGDSSFDELDPGTLRLGIVPGFWANLDIETQSVTATALARLREAGVTLFDVADDRIQELNRAIGFSVVLYEAYDAMVTYLQACGAGIDIRTLVDHIASPDVKAIYERFVLPRRLPAAGDTTVDAEPVYRQALHSGRPALQAHYRELFDNHKLDALLFPTVPVVAPPATADVNGPDIFERLIQNTEPAASAGLPGIQLPAGLGEQTGMPVGLELDGPAGTDRRLLAIGVALESVLGRIAAASVAAWK